MNALVVFHGHGHGPWARLFGSPGLRHCFVCVKRAGYWVRIDSRDGTPLIETVCADTFDLARFYEKQRLTVVAAGVTRADLRAWPLMIASCVGVAKRVIGLRGWRAAFILTPKQLFRHLSARPVRKHSIRNARAVSGQIGSI